MDSKGSQMEPKVAPREAKGDPKTSKGSQGDKLYIHKLPINRQSGQLVYIMYIYIYIYIDMGLEPPPNPQDLYKH